MKLKQILFYNNTSHLAIMFWASNSIHQAAGIIILELTDEMDREAKTATNIPGRLPSCVFPLFLLQY